jgi:DNA replication protein DnaC
MNNSTIIQKLSDLNYIGAKNEYIRQTEDINYQSLSFNERLYSLLESQDIYLSNQKINMLRKLSKIRDKQASIANIDYLPKRKINKQLIIELASMNFIKSYQNVIVSGCTGSGKTYCIQALGNRAIENGYKTYYIRVPTLLEEIKIARATGTYINILKKYQRFQLLILDDFGISQMSSDDAINLLEILEDRVQISSTIIASQLPVSSWYEYLNNNTVADAILDRLVHSSHRLELQGGSMRRIKSTIKKFDEEIDEI